MRASLIVVAYNSRTYLGPCIESIQTEMRDHQDELIVVDNGSTDGSADFVRARYPGVRLICGANAGYAGGNNCGAAVAWGEYLVFLNPDTYLYPGALAALLAPLASTTDVALSTACVVHMRQPEVINTCGNTVHYTGLTYCRGAGRQRSAYRVSAEVDAVSGAAFAIRRAVFEALGGFDEGFFMYVEDTDLSWRARRAGYRCLYVADAVVAHDYQPSYSPAKAFYLDRNRHVMLLKNVEPATYRCMLPGLLLGEMITWGFNVLQGPRYWGVKPRVYRWLWRERHTLSATRRHMRARRRHSEPQVVQGFTHRLEFEQLAGKHISRMAALIFHPAFWMARRLFAGGHL